VNYSAWQNKIAKKSSLLQPILALQVCSVQIMALFTTFELQKIDKFIETPISTMASHPGQLIKSRFFSSRIADFLDKLGILLGLKHSQEDVIDIQDNRHTLNSLFLSSHLFQLEVLPFSFHIFEDNQE
jgi:hypothetical protein